MEELRQLLKGAWNTDICFFTDVMRCLLMAIECNLLAEETQIRGAIAVIDMKGFSAHHLMVLSPWFVRRIVFIITFRLLGNDISSLHEVLPQDFISKEFGGTREDFDYHNQEKFFHSSASHFERVQKFGYLS